MYRRLAALALLATLIGAGLGCRHVGGKCDCQSHPSDGVMTGPTPPYATVPATTPPVKPTK